MSVIKCSNECENKLSSVCVICFDVQVILLFSLSLSFEILFISRSLFLMWSFLCTGEGCILGGLDKCIWIIFFEKCWFFIPLQNRFAHMIIILNYIDIMCRN